MDKNIGKTPTGQAQAFPDKRRAGEERAVVARFVAGVNALGPLSPGAPAVQARLLEQFQRARAARGLSFAEASGE